jgi:hypothetical protein
MKMITWRMASFGVVNPPTVIMGINTIFDMKARVTEYNNAQVFI